MLKYSCVCSLNTCINETDTRMQSKSSKPIGIKHFIHYEFTKQFKSSSTILHFLQDICSIASAQKKSLPNL